MSLSESQLSPVASPLNRWRPNRRPTGCEGVLPEIDGGSGVAVDHDQSVGLRPIRDPGRPGRDRGPHRSIDRGDPVGDYEGQSLLCPPGTNPANAMKKASAPIRTRRPNFPFIPFSPIPSGVGGSRCRLPPTTDYSPNALFRKAAICPRVTGWLGQNRLLVGGLHPRVIPAWANRSIADSNRWPLSSTNRSGPL